MGCGSSKSNARAAGLDDVDVTVTEGPRFYFPRRFYSDTIPRPDESSFDPAIFTRSVASAHRGEAP